MLGYNRCLQFNSFTLVNQTNSKRLVIVFTDLFARTALDSNPACDSSPTCYIVTNMTHANFLPLQNNFVNSLFRKRRRNKVPEDITYLPSMSRCQWDTVDFFALMSRSPVGYKQTANCSLSLDQRNSEKPRFNCLDVDQSC